MFGTFPENPVVTLPWMGRVADANEESGGGVG